MAVSISVIIPTHNRRELLCQALGSVRAQSCPDFEIIVADDASEDGTSELLAAQFPEVLVLRQAQVQGVSAARNLAVERARGEFLAFLDDDDLWLPGYLEQQRAALLRCPEAVLSFSAHQWLHGDGELSWPDLRPALHYDHFRQLMLVENCIFSPSLVMCRRSRWEPMDTLLWANSDVDFYRRLLAGGPAVYLRQPLAHLRLHAGNMSGRPDLHHRQQEEWTRRQLHSDPELSGRFKAWLGVFHLFWSAQRWRAGQRGSAIRLALQALWLSPVRVLLALQGKWRNRHGRGTFEATRLPEIPGLVCLQPIPGR